MTRMASMDWGTAVRPLLSATYGNVCATDLLKLARCIASCRSELLEHSPEHKPFYSSLVALAAHFFGVTVSANNVNRWQLSSFTSACRVLAEYLVKHIETDKDNCPITSNQLVLLVKSLCTGQGCLQRSDIITLAARLKSSQLPTHIRNTIAEKTEDDTRASPRSPRVRKVSSAPTVDPLGSVFDCLVSPLAELQFSTPKVSDDERTADKDERPGLDIRTIKELFVTENIQSLVRVDAFSKLLDVCMQSAHLSAYQNLQIKNVILPKDDDPICSTVDKSLPDLVAELDLALLVLDLPLCENVSTHSLSKLWTVAKCSIIASAFAVCARMRESEEEETEEELKEEQNLDSLAFGLTQCALSKIYAKSLSILRNMSSAEPAACENFHALGTWLLGKIVLQMADRWITPNLIIIDFAEKFVSTTALFFRSVKADSSTKLDRLHELSMSTQANGNQKLAFVSSQVALVPLLFRLVHASLCQVVTMKSNTDSELGQRPAAVSSELSELDPLLEPPAQIVNQSSDSSDQEPLLGTWLEQLLSNVPQLVDAAVKQQSLSRQVSRRRSFVSENLSGGLLKDAVPTTRKLTWFTVETLKHLNSSLLGGSAPSEVLLHVIHQMLRPNVSDTLANVVHCLDNFESHHITDKSLSEIGNETVKVLHNLLVHDYLSENAKNDLVLHLVGHDLLKGTDWSLSLSPRVLGVLGQILFLRLYRENSELGKSDTEHVVVTLWQRLFGRLKRLASEGLRDELKENQQPEDVNVEHLQLLLVLFHALQLMQKKTVLINLCQTLIDIVENELPRICKQRLSAHLARFVLILEYMLRHFYEPPAELLEHVRNNIFPLQTEGGSIRTPVTYNSYGSKMFYSCVELEDKYRTRASTSGDPPTKLLHPTFYDLCKVVWSESEGCPPKLDGLAVNFLLGWEKYEQLYSACVQLLHLSILPSQRYNEKPTVLECASVQYSRSVVWRLLGQMPVAAGYLPQAQAVPASFSDVHILHWLWLSLKLKNPEMVAWLKDTLLKQSLSESQVSSVMDGATGRPTSKTFLLELCRTYFERKLEQWKDMSVPVATNFLDLVNISLVVARLRSLLDSDFKLGTSEDNGAVVSLSNEEKAVVRVLSNVVNKLHEWARTLLICETQVHESGDLFPLSVVEQLLQTFSSGTQISAVEAGRVSEALQTCGLGAAYDIWTSTSLRDYADHKITKSLIDMDDENAVEKLLATVHLAHMNALSVWWQLALFECLRYALENSQHLLCDLIADSRSTSNAFELNEVQTFLMPHLFSAALKSETCDRIHSVLQQCSIAAGQKKEKCAEMENMYFVVNAFELISSPAAIADAGYVRLLLGKLAANIRRSATWPAWSAFLSSDRGKEMVERRLVANYSSGSKSPLNSISFLELISALLDPASDASDENMCKIRRLFLVPLLGSSRLLSDWTKTLKDKLNSTEDVKKRKELAKLTTDVVHRLATYLSVQSKNKQDNEWTGPAVAATLGAILEGLLSELPTESPELGNYALPNSDRWFTSTLTPVCMAITDPDDTKPHPTVSCFDAQFQNLLVYAVKLADLHGGQGHLHLLKYSKQWIKVCKKRLSSPDVLNKLDGIGGAVSDTRLLADMDTTITLLVYMSALMAALKDTPAVKTDAGHTAYDSDLSFVDAEPELQWTTQEEPGVAEEEDSGMDDSGDEENLDARLCTFTITQKEFMNQHWYHCHTCGMVDGEGVCTVCAKVCHKDHDLSYSKFGSFFCDCGAKQNDTCLALVKRVRAAKTAEKSESASTVNLPGVSAFRADALRPSLKFGFSTPIFNAPVDLRHRIFRLAEFTRTFDTNSKNLSPEVKELLRKELFSKKDANLCQEVLDLLARVLPAITKGTEQRSPSVALARQRDAIAQTHSQKRPISFDFGRVIFTHQHSSQGAAFEGAKLNLSGDQGQQIRQLVQNHSLLRTSLSLLTLGDNNRQMLAVAHDRCKLTIVQCASILKQVENNKKKLSLARSAFETLPFTIVTLASEGDCLAVCGIKDCHIFVIGQSGAISDKITMQLELDSNNYVSKALWCPVVRGMLAVSMGDFVNVYDLNKSNRTPRHQFMLPVGRVRDLTFACWETERHEMQVHLIFLSSMGHVYIQQLNDGCLFEDGTPFYVTNNISIEHPEIQEVQGSVAQGGVSAHYSHTLQMLFVGYQDGKNIVVPLKETQEKASQVTVIPPPKKSNDAPSATDQAIYRWSEVLGHAGVVMGLTLNTVSPVALYFGPKALHIQELTAAGKPRMLDFVSVYYESSRMISRLATLVLCEDGGLQFFDASDSHPPDYWLLPPPALLGLASLPPPTRVIGTVKRKAAKTTSAGSGPIIFPVDFFESCQQLPEMEFGGPDLQSRYDSLQLKNRLNTSNLFITCAKTDGFELVVRNRDLAFVVCGLRIELGKQSLERAPTYIEILGRKREVHLTRPRWYDLPLTREESYGASRTFTIKFGPCADNSNTTVVVDTVKVYGKTKEAFGWTDDFEEAVRERIPGAPRIAWAASVDESAPDDSTRTYVDPHLAPFSSNLRRPLVPELLLMAAFDSLDTYFETFNNGTDRPKSAMDLVMSLLCTCMHPAPVQRAKSLLRRLFDTKEHYYGHKDRFMLQFVWNSFPKVAETRDPDLLTRLLVVTRDVAVQRPQNLVQFTNELAELTLTDSTLSSSGSAADLSAQSKSESFLDVMVRIFWSVLHTSPHWPSVAPVGQASLTNLPVMVRSLVEVLHAFCQGDPDSIPAVAKTYAQLLLCTNDDVGHWTKQTLSWIFRPKTKKKVLIPSPPRCSTPGTSNSALLEQLTSTEPPELSPAAPAPAPPILPPPDDDEFVDDEEAPQYELLNAGAPLEALLANAEGLDILVPEDEQAMVELAIALSLQENGQAPVPAAIVAPEAEPVAVVDPAQLSDTTASGLSDEEGSTAATDGSTLRTSPNADERSAPEAPGSGNASESGGSASGRSSTYGEATDAAATTAAAAASKVAEPIKPPEQNRSELTAVETDERAMWSALQTSLLKALLEHFPQQQSGVGCVAFMQTLLLLTNDLNGSEESHKTLLLSLTKRVMSDLDLGTQAFGLVTMRSGAGELNLLKLRMLSVLLSKAKGNKGTLSPVEEFLATQTAKILVEADSIGYCRSVLSLLLDYWKRAPVEKKDNKAKLLTAKPAGPCPDLSPFFLRQYVREHLHDIFECYTQLLTEIALRLPYQIKKVCDGWPSLPQLQFDMEWERLLCEFISCQEAPFVRRQARKLLLVIAGSKEDYRFVRDKYTAETHITAVKDLCGLSPGQTRDVTSTDRALTLSYVQLNDMMERLKSVLDLASSRSSNWQKICLKWDICDCALLPFLLRLSCVVNDVISQVVLDLIQTALFPIAKSSKRSSKHRSKTYVPVVETEKQYSGVAKALTSQLFNKSSRSMLIGFLTRFLLHSSVSERRWQVHALVCRLFENGTPEQQRYILDLLWQELWPMSALHGEKATQLVDLLSYYLVKLCPQDQLETICKDMLSEFRRELNLLSTHPNANLYCALSGYLECEDGYFLERNPCLVCNNPEVAMVSIKLSSVRMDSRSTTASQIVKMVASHEISKVSIKFSELKRAKMVKQLNLFYSNKTVSGAVELKNKPELWSVAKRVTLTPGQTDVKVEFPVPIVASNLMLEFAEFFESQKSASELLHCPRCSASVPANPGVCGNCGENVFQCHKCRSINYDEKDPFLCNSCGFSKYAKFEVSFTGRQVASVEPIENEDDRKKTASYIESLLDKADNTRKQLRLFRVQVESSLASICGQSALPPVDTELEASAVPSNQTSSANLVITASGTSLPPAAINRGIQEMAVRYWKDCKAAFEELSRTIQRILANRNELMQYDAKKGCKIPAAFSTANFYQSSDQCYGCTTARTLNWLHLLRSLSSTSAIRATLIADRDLLHELVASMRKGPKKYETSVQAFLSDLCTDNQQMTDFVCGLIRGRVLSALQGESSAVLGGVLQYELRLLKATFRVRDHLWEQRLKCAFELFIASLRSHNRAAAEHVTLPCMELIRSLLVPEYFKPDSNGQSGSEESSVPHVDLKRWLVQSSAPFGKWQAIKANTAKTIEAKFAFRWLEKCKRARMRRSVAQPEKKWLESGLFCPSSAYTRAGAAAIFRQIALSSTERRMLILDLLTKHLDKLHEYGERANEFVALYRVLICEEQWKCFLSLRKLLPHLGLLITNEVERLAQAEDFSFGTDLTRGYAVRVLADLLQQLLSVKTIRKRWKAELLGPVLSGYLGLRRLIVQRTKLVEDAQAKLLTLLEDLTTGTETETREFMAVCVETVHKYPMDDMLTPVFIFERLCSIIHPEEKDVGEFLINIEKDPAQEDFLQGRMMGNPYSCKDSGMGPLMKDIKNRICRDCELVALLEDDTGMELLVNNKIVSLDLSVADVYKKLWQPQHNGEAMLIMYRMRGLLGDATEEFIETLDKKNDEAINEEEVYYLAKVMGQTTGLQAMLDRLKSVKNLAQGRALLTVLLKLFGLVVKIELNRVQLNRLNTISALLSSLQMLLDADDRTVYVLAEELLAILDVLLEQASRLPPEQFSEMSKDWGTADQILWLLSLIDTPLMQMQGLKEKLIKVTPNLTLGSEVRTAALIEHFKQFLDYNKYDFESQPKNVANQLESFCVIARGIQASRYGSELKDRLLEAGFVNDAAEYLLMHHPPLFKVGLTIDSPEWKDFLSKPALKYVLRILTGLCHSHGRTQMLVAKDCIPIIHRLEQISTEEWLGSLAENLMEALKQNDEVAKKIEQVRQETKLKKKQMAKAMRDRQLMQIGMTVDSKGQVRVSTPKQIKDASDLKEETGLVCSICQEGYKSQPNKVLGIYTYSRRVDAEPFENRSRKQAAYSTVTHFNVVHFDCHLSAVKSHRGREEWESAALHNANTKCNGLLPLWGPDVPESNFANCLARFNADLQAQTGCSDVTFASTVHDLKLLLLRFVENRSFAADTGGGGKESNMQLVPCIALLALYVLTTTKQHQQERRTLNSFLGAKVTDWVASAFAVEGPLYCPTLALLLLSANEWNEQRLTVLRRFLVTAQARNVAPDGTSTRLTDVSVKDFAVYKSYLLFFALLDGIYRYPLKDIKVADNGKWSQLVQDYIRQHDMHVLEQCRELLKNFEAELQPCDSFAEFCDVAVCTLLICAAMLPATAVPVGTCASDHSDRPGTESKTQEADDRPAGEHHDASNTTWFSTVSHLSLSRHPRKTVRVVVDPVIVASRRGVTPALSKGHVLRDRWVIEGMIGGGAYGQIYKAEDKKLNRFIAIKVELQSKKRDSRRMVLETKLMLELQKPLRPYVPILYGADTVKDLKLNYIAMQLLSRNLADLRRISPLGKFSVSSSFRISRQMLEALRDLHNMGYIHRDLKPSNLAFGIEATNKHTLYVIDYGMVRRFKTPDGEMRPARRRVGFRGTLRYVSLRVHNRLDHCPADDLWSWFYTLVEMCNGYLPWRTVTDHARVKRKKETMNLGLVCACMPKCTIDIAKYLETLDFGQMPDYGRIDKYLSEVLRGINASTKDPYDWEIHYRSVLEERRNRGR